MGPGTMKPPHVTSVLLVGPQDSHKSSFLMQGAVHYAQQGHTVVYITATEFDSLPLPLQGLPRPTPDVFSLIKFLYLPCWQDLLQHVFSFHLHALMPTVVIVEALEHFCNVADNETDAGNFAKQASHTALVCAALLDGAAVCAKRSSTRAHLIVSLNQQASQIKLSPLIDIFFTDVVWMFECAKSSDHSCDSGEYCMTNLEIAGSRVKEYKIVFKPQPNEGAVVMSKVSFWEKMPP